MNEPDTPPPDTPDTPDTASAPESSEAATDADGDAGDSQLPERAPAAEVSTPAAATSVTDARWPDRGRPWLRQRVPAVMLLLGLALGVVAFVVYPRPSDLPSPSYVTITVTSRFPIGVISYNVTSTARPRFTVAELAITLQLSSAQTLTSSTRATVAVTSPNSIPFQQCPTTSCVNAPRALALTSTLTFTQPESSRTATFRIRAENFGETSNGLTAAAAIPQVFYNCANVLNQTCSGTPQLEARYNLPAPKDYDWSSFPTQLEKPTYAVWNEPVAGPELPGRVAVGINHDNQKWNDDKTFLAGAIIGLAGAALLAAAQEWLHAKDEDEDEDEPTSADRVSGRSGR